MKKLEFFLLVLILLSAFIVRLYRFNGPIADWQSWRQADTSAVSRNFILKGFDILHPRFDDLSNVPSGKDNPNGYRFVEFPLYNFFQAGFYTVFNYFTIEQWGRLVTIFSSLLSIIFINAIVGKYINKTSGLIASGFFAFIPFNIYYGRSILPDPTMVMAILGGIYFFDKWLEENSNLKSQISKLHFKSQIFFVLSIIFTASAFLLKPFALFFTLPMIYLAFKNFGFSFIRKWELWLFVILTVSPLVFWRMWMLQYPEGIASNSWLFNEGNIRFKGAFFYWLFADRMARLILGYWGVVFLVLGLIRKRTEREGMLFLSFLASSLLYLIVIARGNVQHDYYQILILPTIAIFVSLGVDFLLKTSKEYFDKIASYLLIIIISIFTFSFGWYFIRDYFNINNFSIISAGKTVDSLLPKDVKIIAQYGGDTSFLYQTKRQGWASFEKSLPEMVKMGAQYLILVNPNDNDFKLGKEYKIISSSSEYIIFELFKK